MCMLNSNNRKSCAAAKSVPIFDILKQKKIQKDMHLSKRSLEGKGKGNFRHMNVN